MGKIHLVIPDQHAHPKHSNERADWLSKLIIDVKPDVVINIGDAADMSSLSSYDKGKRSFTGQSYRKDIDSHLDFQDRLWQPILKRKKKQPRTVVLEGNHEHRVERALDLSPELSGTIGFEDYKFKDYYDDVVRYEGGTPGVIEIDGIEYAHYFPSGTMGRPAGGEHAAYTLLTKRHKSSTCGHLHTADFCVRPAGSSGRIMASVVGCFQDYTNDWVGEAASFWWRGVMIKHNVENGQYDPEWVSIDRMRKIYSNVG
jgi:hypothetical protein